MFRLNFLVFVLIVQTCKMDEQSNSEFIIAVIIAHNYWIIQKKKTEKCLNMLQLPNFKVY